MARVLFAQNIWFKMIGTMTLSRCLKAEGHAVDLVIGSPAQVVKRARGFAPDLIGFSCMTLEVTWFKRTVLALRRAGIRTPIILGGSHATFSPDILREAPFEYICVGEGERTLPELARALEEGADPTGIGNLCFLNGGRLRQNPLHPLVTDLDTLGFLDRGLYEGYPYFRDDTYEVFLFSRGCPYGCTFCYNHLWRELYGLSAPRSARYVSVDHAIEDIRQVCRSREIRTALFADNLLVYDPAWFRAFITRYAETFALPFTCTIRAEHVREETIALLKRANCVGVRFAVETGDEAYRARVLGKPIRNRRLIHLADLLRRNGIPFLTYNMFALPGETVPQTLETIHLNQRMAPTYMSNNIFMPYPRYAVTEYAIRKGFLSSADLPRLTEKAYRMDRSVLAQPDVRTVENLHKLSFVMIRHPRWTRFLARLARLPPNPLFKLVYGLSHARDFMRLTGTTPVRFLWQVVRNYRAIG